MNANTLFKRSRRLLWIRQIRANAVAGNIDDYRLVAIIAAPLRNGATNPIRTARNENALFFHALSLLP